MEDEDDLDIFALEDKIKNGDLLDENQELQKKIFMKTQHKKAKSQTELDSKILRKFQEKDKFEFKRDDIPPCTRYNPKYDFVWKKTSLVGASWKTSMKKTSKPKLKEDQGPDFYLTQDFKFQGKNFIDMNKMKDREGFIDEKNISREVFQRTFLSQNTSLENNRQRKVNKKKHVKGPDFRKTMSRERLEHIHGDKKSIIPFCMPKYEAVRDRPIVLVKYEKMLDRKDQIRNKPQDHFTNYDIDKILTKINNYKKPVTPDFKRMISRPDGEGPLPLYMKRNYTRQGAGICSENSLKMNGYADSKFLNSSTCFFPKKSFNKIINLNLITSKKFKENLGVNENEDGEEKEEVNNKIKKALKFYNKNFDDLLKESTLSKFDSVTYKTIKKNQKIDENELKKFLVDFD